LLLILQLEIFYWPVYGNSRPHYSGIMRINKPSTSADNSVAITPEVRTPQGYTLTAKGLHWLMAVMVLGLFGLGIYMADLPLSPERLQLYSWHKWAGVTVFVLVWIRLFWRLRHPAPPLPSQMTSVQRRAAHLGHGALYLLMLAIPLTGWMMSSAKGFQTVWFGVLPLPDLIDKSRETSEALAVVHKGLAVALMALVIGHTAMALKHQFKDRDGTLSRMLFGSAETGLRPEVRQTQTAPSNISTSSE
jgi:cytochrome b561